MFEGLGLGSRLSALNLPGKWNYARYVAAVFYSICTPVGVAIGLGVRESYNGNGAKASIISGVLDATSAGILLYTGESTEVAIIASRDAANACIQVWSSSSRMRSCSTPEP